MTPARAAWARGCGSAAADGGGLGGAACDLTRRLARPRGSLGAQRAARRGFSLPGRFRRGRGGFGAGLGCGFGLGAAFDGGGLRRRRGCRLIVGLGQQKRAGALRAGCRERCDGAKDRSADKALRHAPRVTPERRRSRGPAARSAMFETKTPGAWRGHPAQA